MKRIFLRLLALVLALMCNLTTAFSQEQWKHGRLEVSSNGHFLQYQDGTPFFWLGDTGWDLFLKLDLDDIKTYLDNRAAKGFNVIQAVALSERNGLRRANSYGEVPFKHLDPAQPNEKYFALIDSTIRLAAARQIFIGLLPTWGDKVSKMWGVGPVVFDSVNAYIYGKWLGNRYKDAPNIIWIMGGDRPAFTDSMDWRPVWRAMIRGIRQGTGGKAIITYHPWGEHSSSEFWQGEDVLDINMLQSGHARHDFDVWDMILHDYHLMPPKPVLDGEPNYEDHPVDWKPNTGRFLAYDVRKQIYRSVFSGACGVTYGHNSIFQFYMPGDPRINYADRSWKEGLNRPGAFQAGFLKKLILSRPPLNRVPDQSILLAGQGKENADHITAFRDGEGSYAMIYLPVGKKISVNTSCIKSKFIKSWWFNPRTGSADPIGIFDNKGSRSFNPPAAGVNNDWVLVLDDAGKHWPAPGSRRYGKGEITSGDFILGIDFFSNANPVGMGDTSSDLYKNVVRSLPFAVDAANQHILNFGGNIGIDMPDPGYKNCGPDCDSLWNTLDWSSVDARIKLMRDMNMPVRIITLYGAPNFMTQKGNDPSTPNQKPGWDTRAGQFDEHAQIDPQYNRMWADLCHYIVKRYLPMGVQYYQVWNEMKGYYANPLHPTADGVTYHGWDFPGYTAMYNAVWDRIKNDPATASAKIGGPYAIMTSHQADGTTTGARGPTWASKEGDTGRVVLKGKWGGVRPEITEGLLYWHNHAHGWDFICVDSGPGDDAGNHGGSYNPNGWSTTYTRSYWYDVGKWLHDNIADGKPVVFSEVYPDATGKDWIKSLDMMRDPALFGLSPCRNVTTNDPEPCINLTLEWGDNSPAHNFFGLTDSSGHLTPLGKTYESYKKAHPFKSK